MLLFRQIGAVLIWAVLSYIFYSEGKRSSRWISSIWLRLGLLLGAYVVFIILLETKIGPFLATLNDATPLDESPLFNWNFGLLGRVILAFALLVLPALAGVLVGEWGEKPKDA